MNLRSGAEESNKVGRAISLVGGWLAVRAVAPGREGWDAWLCAPTLGASDCDAGAHGCAPLPSQPTSINGRECRLWEKNYKKIANGRCRPL